MSERRLDAATRETLLRRARAAIASTIGAELELPPATAPPPIVRAGAFVTLRVGGDLRGRGDPEAVDRLGPFDQSLQVLSRIHVLPGGKQVRSQPLLRAGWFLAWLEDDPDDRVGAAIARANATAVERMLGAQPFLVDVRRAGEAIPGLEGRMLLHSGPPIDWARMCGPVQGAAIGACLFEGWASSPSEARRLLAEARLSVSGGKRFRAAFCYWGHRAVVPDAADEDALVRACAALELLHASALVHDDLMDASDTRRGRPATHRQFGADHRAAGWRGDPEQYGGAAAILLGDLLLSWADELLRRCGLPLEQVAPALDVFDRCRSEVIAGQFLDVSVQARGRADVDTAMTVLRYKSAKYSIERPLHIGAALAGATPAVMADLSAYGLPLGEAFQLRDDLLGVFGDPATPMPRRWRGRCSIIENPAILTAAQIATVQATRSSTSIPSIQSRRLFPQFGSRTVIPASVIAGTTIERHASAGIVSRFVFAVTAPSRSSAASVEESIAW